MCTTAPAPVAVPTLRALAAAHDTAHAIHALASAPYHAACAALRSNPTTLETREARLAEIYALDAERQAARAAYDYAYTTLVTAYSVDAFCAGLVEWKANHRAPCPACTDGVAECERCEGKGHTTRTADCWRPAGGHYTVERAVDCSDCSATGTVCCRECGGTSERVAA